MSLGDFLRKQLIDVIQWMETEDGILAYRFPMRDMEIQYGAQLTVRDSQVALFVNEGKTADLLGPGRHVLTTQNVPLLTDLLHWYTGFESPFKSDVYFFSTRLKTNQQWGTQQPITVRDRDFGAVRVRGFGIYAYHVENPVLFYMRVSGTRDVYRVADLEGHLRNTIVSSLSDAVANSGVPFLDMAANLNRLGATVREHLAPSFVELGLGLDSFVVESLSLPDELQKRLDERVGMNMVGDLGRYTQYEAARSIPIAAANEGAGGGGAAGLGVGMGAGMAMGKAMGDALGARQTGGGQRGDERSGTSAQGAGRPEGGESGEPAGLGAPPATHGPHPTKFCIHCGKTITRQAAFCPECGGAQPAGEDGGGKNAE
jgi:membrane protease subunit (stomatin/prohibitin family)